MDLRRGGKSWRGKGTYRTEDNVLHSVNYGFLALDGESRRRFGGEVWLGRCGHCCRCRGKMNLVFRDRASVVGHKALEWIAEGSTKYIPVENGDSTTKYILLNS